MSSDTVAIETFVASPGALAEATCEVAAVLRREGLMCPLKVAEDVAFAALKGAHRYEQKRRTKSSGHAEAGVHHA